MELRSETWLDRLLLQPEAQDAVQVRLARDLHDTVGQILTTMVVDLEQFRREQYGRKSVIDEIDRVQADARAVLANLRRILHELREEPAETSLLPELEAIVGRSRERSDIDFTLDIAGGGPDSLSAHVGRHVLMVVEEASNNARRHSGAKAVRISVRTEAEAFTVAVEDDGVGIDAVLPLHGSFGLRGMRERAALVGGWLDVEPRHPRGTSVRLTVPLAPAAIAAGVGQVG